MPRFFRIVTFLSLLLILATCTDPVEPVFRFETGFLLVEGRIVDQPGLSAIRLSRNEILFDNYTLVPIPGATVSCIDNDGQEVNWEQVGSTSQYRAPEGWAAEAGRSYSLRVVTPQGEVIESIAERVPTNVPVADARIKFEQEAYFSTGRNRFIPAFTLLVDLDDPADEANFYQHTFSTIEDIDVCASCERARWRNGVCIEGPDTRFVNRWDYLCDAPCWFSAQGSGSTLLSDAFSNGRRIEDIEAGRVDFIRPGGLLFLVEQYNVSAAAYDYGLVLKDLAEGSGGLNAPLPSALVGNLTDVSENGTSVLGFVGVAAANIERVYIDRDTVIGQSLPYDGEIRLEPVIPSPPVAPCEGGTRTRVRPAGWPE